ncbi:MAG: response regulator [Deltaproteobacteria bacterium]|nr:response regulator [Deltaproteobacteria bacterium]
MTGPGAQRHVLLVDDDPDIRYIAEIALARVGGLAVSLAGSAAEARVRLEGPLPDVLLLDVTMPLCDGPTFFRELRQDGRFAALPIIFLTARTSLDDVQGFLDMGVHGVVAKPFDPMTLAKQLGGMLGW